MTNFIVGTLGGDEGYMKSGGVGSDLDPFIPVADVNVQDQDTATIILPAAEQLGADSLDGDAAIESYDVTVVDSTGMTIGDHFRIINSAADRYYFGSILNIVGNVITLDTPVDFLYVSGSEVTWSNINMAVDGSVTPVHFHLRTGTPSIPSAVDITRIIMTCETNGVGDLAHFGDILALTRGLVMRKENGDLHNIFNVKTNADLASLAYDLNGYVASNPIQGINGFAWRLTFGGQSKIGVVLRVLQGGQLGFIVQDDLTDLVNLKVMFEGHVVEGAA